MSLSESYWHERMDRSRFGIFDIHYVVTSLKCFSEATRESHIKRLLNIFGCLQRATVRQKSIVIYPGNISYISDKGSINTYWLYKYPGMKEGIYVGLREPQGWPRSTTVYFDSEHAYYQVTRLSVSRVMRFVGSNTTVWFINTQVSIETSSYSVYFCDGWVATEEAILIWYMLRYSSVPIMRPTALCGYNYSMIIPSTNRDSELIKNIWIYNIISYMRALHLGFSTPLRFLRWITDPISLPSWCRWKN